VRDAEWNYLLWFKPEEFDNPTLMDFQFLQKLDTARGMANIPFKITSDYRADSDLSPHRTGRAVDIRANTGWTKFKIVQALLQCGFLRIGVYNNHIHVDEDRQGPSPTMWIGESQ
jgi:hypothetical protein